MATSAVNGVNGIPQTNGVTSPGAKGLPSRPHSGHPSSYAAKYNLADHFIGGNHLGVAPAGVVKDFVADNDGHTVITSVRFNGRVLEICRIWLTACTRS